MGKSGESVLKYIESQGYDFNIVDKEDIKSKIKRDYNYFPKDEIINAVAVETSTNAPKNFLDVFNTISPSKIIDTVVNVDSGINEIRREIEREERERLEEIGYREASQKAVTAGKMSRVVTSEAERKELTLTEKQTLGRFLKQLR